MEISKIKTRKEFWELADIQYHRTKKLARLWNDKTKSDIYRVKAYGLWTIMFSRIITLNKLATKLNEIPKDFKSGGIVSHKISGEEETEFKNS